MGELSLAMKACFGEDVVDVVDVSMQNYGVSVRQAPCELAVVVSTTTFVAKHC
jgi:hypothetical protein